MICLNSMAYCMKISKIISIRIACFFAQSFTFNIAESTPVYNPAEKYGYKTYVIFIK